MWGPLGADQLELPKGMKAPIARSLYVGNGATDAPLVGSLTEGVVKLETPMPSSDDRPPSFAWSGEMARGLVIGAAMLLCTTGA